MNNKRASYFWFVIALALIVLNFYSFYTNGQIIKKWNLSSELLGKKHEATMLEVTNNIILRETSQFLNEGITINGNIKLVPDHNEELDLRLSTLLSNEQNLIFNFTDITCRTCLESEVKMINELANDIGSEKIIILANYRRQQDLILFKRLNQIKVKVYNKKEGSLNMPIEEEGSAFMFVSDSKLKAQYVFIPDKDLPELSEKYYSLIKEKLN